MPTARTAFGITYYSYSLHDWRKLRTPHDIPRNHWPILRRAATNFQWANRIDNRVGAIPQKGGVDHIGAGFQDNNPIDLGAERLTEYGLNPANTRASWNGAVDSNSICLLAPPDTRPWQHGVTGSPYDLNSYGLGVEDGVLSSDWRRLLPSEKREAHYRMRAAWWALWMGHLGWPLKFTPTAAGVWDHIRRGESWGLTQHGTVDPRNRTDTGYVWVGGQRINTFDYYDTLFPMIRQEQGIRTSGAVTTPGLPAASDAVKALQKALNEWGNNLDVDGHDGPLTTAAAKQAAADTGYTGDVKDAAALTKHLEDTMSTLAEIPGRTRDAVMGTRFPGAADNRLDDILVATWRTSRANAAEIAALKATVEALATSQGLDPGEVTRIVREGVQGALGTLEADVTLTVAGAASKEAV